jgi:hypothetical protein
MKQVIVKIPEKQDVKDVAASVLTFSKNKISYTLESGAELLLKASAKIGGKSLSKIVHVD